MENDFVGSTRPNRTFPWASCAFSFSQVKVNSFYIGTLKVNLPLISLPFFLERASVRTNLTVLKFCAPQVFCSM